MAASTPSTAGPEYERARALYLKVKELKDAIAANRISRYRPNPKQAKFHGAGTAPVRIVEGGNRFGKTTCGAIEAIAHSLGYRPWLPEDHPDRIVRLCNGDPIPVPNVGRILISNFEVNVKQTIHPKLMEWAPKGEIVEVHKNQRSVPVEYKWKNGSTTYLLSGEQDDNAFEGQNGHWGWVDEPCSQRKFNGLQRGLVDFDGHVWMTLTPLEEPWIHEVLGVKANEPGSTVWAIRGSIWDNCVERGGVLSRAAIEAFLENVPKHERPAREEGRPLHLAGLVFKEWSPEPPFWVDPVPLEPHWPRVCLIDPHPRKPIAVMWAAVSPDNVWHVYRELWDDELTTVEDVVRAMREAEGWQYAGDRYVPFHDRTVPHWRRTPDTEHVAMYVIDTSGNEPEKTSGDTVAEQFERYGISCQNAYKRNRDAGIKAIREALRLRYEWSKPGLVVFNTCPTVKHNFMSYVWDRWGTSRQSALKGEKQDAVKWNDDFIDLIRYIFQMRLTYQMLRTSAFRQTRDERDDEDPGDALRFYRRKGVTETRGRRDQRAARR